jgi:LacI family transcriptional regulator
MQPKLKDIARELGVSAATVSNTLNGNGRVSEETRQRIWAKAAEVGYRPSLVGRALRTGRSGVLGLVLPDISNPLFPAIAQAIEADAARKGFGVLIADSHGDGDAQTRAIERMVQRGADGIVVVPCRGTQIPQTVLPVAVIDTASNPDNTVAADHSGGGRLAMTHMQELGHRKILLVGQSRRSLVQSDRIAGMSGALWPGNSLRAIWLEDAPDLDISGLIAQRFTALITTSDLLALMILVQIQQNGHVVPRDISVMGFDDHSFSSMITPGLTTLAQDTAAIAACAVDNLVARLNNQPTPPERTVPMRLIIRDTTSVAPNTAHSTNSRETHQCD